MGNCIGSEMFPSLDGEEEEFEVTNFSNNFSRKALVTNDSKPESGEVYCLVPEKVEHCGFRLSQGAAGNRCGGRRVKIVLTKQQLEHLVRSMKGLQQIRAHQSLRTREQRQKWRPSLATIPEL